MNANPQFSSKAGIEGLMEAFVLNHGENALSRAVMPAQWVALANYMQPFKLAQSQVLTTQGTQDRTLYFVENGSLSVHSEDAALGAILCSRMQDRRRRVAVT
jgi:CRP/FNR family cyclic AMP-dependent transcriptional regulator